MRQGENGNVYLDACIGVAALCPGWVNTKIYESGYSRPSRADHEMTEEDDKTLEGAKNSVATGLPPRTVALWVIESTKQDAGYIFTNRELHGATEERAGTLRVAYDACLASPLFDRSDA